jgi:hypothetical protein
MTYFVDYENGSDANSGTIEKPFRSINYALELGADKIILLQSYSINKDDWKFLTGSAL